MTVTKLHSLVNLIRIHKKINSTNKLAELAVEAGICSRKTVYSYTSKLKKFESIKCEEKDSHQWAFVDVTNSKNINLQEALEIADQLIEKVYKEIAKIRKMRKKTLSNERESIIGNIVDVKIEILLEEHRLDFFESIGFTVQKYKKRTDDIKLKLRKLNLDLDKAVFELDSVIAGSVFERILKLFYGEKNTSP